MNKNDDIVNIKNELKNLNMQYEKIDDMDRDGLWNYMENVALCYENYYYLAKDTKSESLITELIAMYREIKSVLEYSGEFSDAEKRSINGYKIDYM